MKVLLLGGTREARALSHEMAAAGVDLITSLAGATMDPKPYGGQSRRGGFGGVAGLIAFCRAETIGAVVNATHPFAAQMTGHAAEACAALDVPLLHLRRRPWPIAATWNVVSDITAAAAAIPAGSVAFLATGRRSVDAFVDREDVELIVRVAEDTGAAFAGRGRFLVKQPPFSVEEEAALFQELGVTHLVARNAGGPRGREKFHAAETLGLGIIAVAPPPMPEGDRVETVEAALDWVSAL